MSNPEEMYFGEEVPSDIVGTGVTIPGDLENISKLREILEDMKEFGKKSYEFNVIHLVISF